jgi:WD40 repeat protein
MPKITRKKLVWSLFIVIVCAVGGLCLKTYFTEKDKVRNFYITALAWSPDGRHFAVGLDYANKFRGNDSLNFETTQIFTAAGQKVCALQGSLSQILALAWSPDGSRMITIQKYNKIIIWDTQTGQALVQLKGHEDRTQGLAWSPDGSRILTGSTDKTIRIWDAGDGAMLHRLQSDVGNEFLAAAWSPDSEKFAIATYKQFWIFNARDQHLLYELKPLDIDKVYGASLGFSSDGARLLFAPAMQPVAVYSTYDGRKLAETKEVILGHSASWSPDGSKILGIGTGAMAYIWDSTNAEVLRTFPGSKGFTFTAAWSTDSKQILTGKGHVIQCWDAENGQEIYSLDLVSYLPFWFF